MNLLSFKFITSSSMDSYDPRTVLKVYKCSWLPKFVSQNHKPGLIDWGEFFFFMLLLLPEVLSKIARIHRNNIGSILAQIK